MNHILYLTQSLLEIPKGRRKDAKEERNIKQKCGTSTLKLL